MRRQVALLVLFAAFVPGCIMDGQVNCDDDNPCTFDSSQDGSCLHKPLNGPVDGCFGSGGCMEYSCFDGSCILQRLMQCCGNGACDSGESYERCPSDCQATCYDGEKNQGEQGVDCGGPCSLCESERANYLRKLGALRLGWQASAANYTESVREYEESRNSTQLISAALTSYGESERIRGVLQSAIIPRENMQMRPMFNDTLTTYMAALEAMSKYAGSGKDAHRQDANRLVSEAFELDRAFVREYNRAVDDVNKLEIRCVDFVQDQGEDGVDCGGPCRTPCETILNVTKRVTVRIEGGPAKVKVNVSSPAINYPPQQRIIESSLEPIPDRVSRSGEGNVNYEYELDMPAYGITELYLTQTLRFRRAGWPAKSASDYESPIYLKGNNYSIQSEEICREAGLIRDGANSTAEYSMAAEDWMNRNIVYELNHEELGAQYSFLNGRGACDEQADLFVSLMRCGGVPSRRVTGSLVNGSQLGGHAWAEYYDGGWVYVDPSARKSEQAFTFDNKHVVACVGEGAYNCGVGYYYTYAKKRPTIEITERIYMR